MAIGQASRALLCSLEEEPGIATATTLATILLSSLEQFEEVGFVPQVGVQKD
jgi:hypothetical protein